MRTPIPDNRLLESLPQVERDLLLAAGRYVEAPPRQLISAAGDAVDTLYFPVAGMASMVAPDEGGASVEVLTVGREGCVGVSALFGLERLPFEVVWQVPSRAVAIDLAEVRHRLPSCPQLQLTAARYQGSLLVQAGQNAACNHIHLMEQRAAKWLLLMHDRVQDDGLELPQELLAAMLGVTRPKLSLVEQELRQAGLIGPRRRGSFEILDRAGLDALACECYAIISRELAFWFRGLTRARPAHATAPGRRRVVPVAVVQVRPRQPARARADTRL